MIEKMKMVHVVTTAEHKDDMLEGLRSLGLLHLAEQKQASQAASERFTELARVSSKLQEYLPESKDTKKDAAGEAPALLSDEAFEQLYQEVRNALAKKDQLTQQITADTTEMERIEPWGQFSPRDVRELQKLGYDLHFYRVDKDVCAAIMADESLRVLRLASVDKADTIAVIGTLAMSYNASVFTRPDRGLAGLQVEVAGSTRRTQRSTPPQAKPRKAIHSSYGCPVTSRRSTSTDSRKVPARITGHTRSTRFPPRMSTSRRSFATTRSAS